MLSDLFAMNTIVSSPKNSTIYFAQSTSSVPTETEKIADKFSYVPCSFCATASVDAYVLGNAIVTGLMPPRRDAQNTLSYDLSFRYCRIKAPMLPEERCKLPSIQRADSRRSL